MNSAIWININILLVPDLRREREGYKKDRSIEDNHEADSTIQY